MSAPVKRKMSEEDETERPETEDARREKWLTFRKFEAELEEQKRLRKEKIQINREKHEEKRKLAELGINEDEGSEDKEDLGRKWTVSIAVPASLLNNAISAEMRTYIAGELT